MSSPRVSIGVPVYNGERFLAQSLDSLLAQTFTDFELAGGGQLLHRRHRGDLPGLRGARPSRAVRAQ